MMKSLKRIYKRFITPLLQVRPANLPRYARYISQLRQYHSMGGTTDALWPILGENTGTSAIDPHYFYQGVWAARHIVTQRPLYHVDVGSQTNFVGFLTSITKVRSVDIRPLKVDLENFESVPGSILEMPMPTDSVPSLSCLHVAEHIGLGRYGDPLDPRGTEKACAELSRVLAPGGVLYFSLPIGRERTEFNAHRIHRPQAILGYFSDLKLVSFGAVDDTGHFREHADIQAYDQSRYACGLFCFTKEEKKS